jgi:hypothetical protein
VRSGATNRVKKLTPSCPRIASGRGGHEKGDPGLLRKTGAYRPNGVRGVGGWGARPPGTSPTRRRQYSSCLRISFLSVLRPRAAGMP